MIERIENAPPGVDALKAVGKVSKEDYDEAFQPLLDQAEEEGRRIKCLYQFGPEFQGFTPGAAWQDLKIGLGSMRFFSGCAIVSDLSWIREFSRVAAFFMPCPVKVFDNQELEEAAHWLSSLSESAALSHRLVPESGVVVVDIKDALRAQDFDALALTIDAWIEEQGALNGLVIHAREFPGWENFGSFLRHLRFVRHHHAKIRRIALAADSRLASLLPDLAQHFVQAEVKDFGYDELQTAIAWAGEGAERLSQPAASLQH